MTAVRRSLRAMLLALAAGCSCTPTLAQPGATPTPQSPDPHNWWNPPFTPKPGAYELTGRIIVFPKQREDLPHLSAPAYAERAQEARAAASIYNPVYIAALDEYLITVPDGHTEESLANQLLATGLYNWVRPDWKVYPTRAHEVIPDDPQFAQQWNLMKVQAPAAWDISPGSPNIIVAVVDTGVDFTHPDLAPNMVLGCYSFGLVNRPQTLTPPNNNIVMDVNGHGTGVAGVVAAVGNNNLGMTGTGWNLRVMPIRVSNTSDGASSIGNIQLGSLWATSNGARVVTVSYAGIEDPAIDNLGRVVRSRNALLVWSMDNSGTNTNDTFPFDHPNITVVSGTNPQDERWTSAGDPTHVSSSYGNGVDIAAPASSITVTTIGGGYAIREGNSFATPMVAAGLGMIWGVAPGMTPADVESVLLASADDIGPPGEDIYFGVGRLNLRRALWNAVVRQNAVSLPPAPYNEFAFSIDDIYDFLQSPMDVTGDNLIDPKDTIAVQAFMRRNEVKDLGYDRP